MNKTTLLSICLNCKYSDFDTYYPDLWCDKYVELVNVGINTIESIAQLGCQKCIDYLQTK